MDMPVLLRLSEPKLEQRATSYYAYGKQASFTDLLRCIVSIGKGHHQQVQGNDGTTVQGFDSWRS